MLHRLDHLPDGFLTTSARDLYRILPGPTLIELPGERPAPLFVSILLHGNEDVGLKAMQRVLARFRDRPLPRALALFVGNVEAARFGLRRLDGQPDFNRIWPGHEDETEGPEHRMAAQVVEIVRARGPFASIDLHNNTGRNPHYACVNVLERPHLHLAALFGRIVVYFLRPRGVQSMAFAPFCPAVTVECGRVGETRGEEHAADFVEAALRLDHFPEHPVPAHDIDLFHTVATVKIPPEVSFTFGEGEVDLCLPEDLDRLNFTEVPAGTVLGRACRGSGLPLSVVDEAGRDATCRFFRRDGDEIRFARPVMPSMLTLDERVIRQDCLCYLMERYPLPDGG